MLKTFFTSLLPEIMLKFSIFITYKFSMLILKSVKVGAVILAVVEVVEAGLVKLI